MKVVFGALAAPFTQGIITHFTPMVTTMMRNGPVIKILIQRYEIHGNPVSVRAKAAPDLIQGEVYPCPDDRTLSYELDGIGIKEIFRRLNGGD